MALIIAALAVLAAALGLRIALLNREVAAMAASISRIRERRSNERLTVATPNRALRALASAVNELYEDAYRLRGEHARSISDMHAGLASLSHDLRTPLTSLMGYLRLLQEGAQDEAQGRRYLGVACRKAKAMQELVEGVYDLSRIEAGAMGLQAEAVDAAELLAEELASLYDRLNVADSAPEVSIEAPLCVIADAVALRRAFSNLLGNLIDHGSGGIRILGRAEAESAVFVFSNLAPGLSEADVARMFHRFYTGDASRHTAHAGLGLAIAKELVERMGGTISADLEKGRLTIRVRWPRMEGKRLETAGTQKSGIHGR